MDAVLSSTSFIMRSVAEFVIIACRLNDDCAVDGEIEEEVVATGGRKLLVFGGIGVMSPTARRESKRLFVLVEVSVDLAIGCGVGVAV